MTEQLAYYDSGTHVVASMADPYPVQVVSQASGISEPVLTDLTVNQMMARNINWFDVLTAEGRVFYASDAAANDRVTGQTSFANTTPTFMLRVQSGTVCVPLLVALGQTGTVAGGAVTVIIESDNADRFSSGTAETVYSARTGGNVNNAVTAHSTVTATNAYGARLMGITVAADVEPAEGISNEVIWTPSGPDFLVGPASFLVYTFAASTGPTWLWTLKWLEFPISRFGF